MPWRSGDLFVSRVEGSRTPGHPDRMTLVVVFFVFWL